MNDKRKIIIVTGEPIPNGMACTQRLLTFARGFIANGVDVMILAIVPHEDRYNNKEARGVIDGIEYVYTCGVANKSKYFWLRRWHRLKGFLSCVNRIHISKNKIEGVLFIGNGGISLSAFAIGLLAKLFNVVTLLERTEVPYYNKSPKGVFAQFNRIIYENIFHRIFSGIVVISDSLYDYYKQRKSKKLIKVPIIVDNSFFRKARNNHSIYFMCSGALSQHQSGLINLVKAFCVVAEKYTDVDLVLTGMQNKEDETEYKKIITQAGLEDRVIFKGYIERDQLLDLMMNASCFVLPKPDNLQNRFCFASKIAEYMATGNPLITSKLGEICNYCEEGKNVFFVTPDNITELSDKMIYVLEYPEKAEEIGTSGKLLANSVFDNKQQSKILLNFMRSFRGDSETSC